MATTNTNTNTNTNANTNAPPPSVSIPTPTPLGPLITDTTPATVPSPLTPLHGTHVTLNPFTPSHIPALWSTVGSHPQVFTWWPEGPYDTESDFAKPLLELLESAAAEQMLMYVVIPRDGEGDGEPVGLALAQAGKNLNDRVAEIGALFGPALQRTRAGTEALALMLGVFFEHHLKETAEGEVKSGPYRRVAWRCNALNVASRRCAERLGMGFEGVSRQNMILPGGRSRDTAWYAMMDYEWPMCKRALELWLEEGNFDEVGRQRKGLVEIREGLVG